MCPHIHVRLMITQIQEALTLQSLDTNFSYHQVPTTWSNFSFHDVLSVINFMKYKLCSQFFSPKITAKLIDTHDDQLLTTSLLSKSINALSTHICYSLHAQTAKYIVVFLLVSQ